MGKIKEKTIEGIEPFNDFALGSCFSHALISVLSLNVPREKLVMSHALKNLTTVNECFYFQPINNSTTRLIDDKSVIDFQKSKYSDSYIIEKINLGTPLIVGVDCFYLNIRPDTYKNRHIQHFLTVFGYDIERQIYHIIEHSYVNGHNYIKREISMKSLKKAATSFEKTLCEDKKSVTEACYKKHWKKYYSTIFADAYKQKNDIFNILEGNIELLKSTIEKGFYYVNALCNVMVAYFQRLRMISCCMLKFITNKNERNLIEMCENIISSTTFFSGAIGRIGHSKDTSFFIYRKSDFLNRLDVFSKQQKQFIELIFEVCNE